MHRGMVVASRPIDVWLLLSTILLVGLGILMVFSTTAVASEQMNGDGSVMIKQHIAHVCVGFVVLYCAFRLPPVLLYRLAVPAFIVALFLLTITLIPGIGHVAGGARRWLILGPLRLQPGELAKVATLLYFASYVNRHSEKMSSFVPGVVIPGALLSIFAMLLLAEPDFGSTVVILLVVFSQLMMYCRTKHLILIGSAGVTCLALLVAFSPYRFKRFVTFLDPFHDPSAAGYQLIQSLIAVGSGGMSGAGLGSGHQKLFYLPAAHTDFIFAVIAEELGILGALFVIGLFLLILYRGLRITFRLEHHPFLSCLSLGCTVLMVVPAVLNMSVVLGMLPTKGLVLPLVAYGGTAMLVHLGAMGVLLRLSRLEEK